MNLHPTMGLAAAILTAIFGGVCLYRSLRPPPHLDNVDRIIEGVFAIMFLVLAHHLMTTSRP